ncbi:LOW QUALITY PROTEIN: hypothetical protein OSB04_028340 [Centaurea solstitialis]|uniref:Uncharacterized protein n=1 Tax=Centaurea solstitialis TaxID=347529 RepID=A0AA38W957_9ASTR|nr:LOW QUALITY PROTEIN: hypothetical protein OSB04_028340 [Centaurea solstitialis]
METRSQQARLDQHNEQLQQLQYDVSEIKAAIKVWEVDHAAEEEFHTIVMPNIRVNNRRSIQGSINGFQRSVGDFDALMGGTPLILSQGSLNSRFPQRDGFTNFPWAAKKIKLPEFSGFDPRGWIKKA